MLFISQFSMGQIKLIKQRIYLNLLILSVYKLKISVNNVEMSSCRYQSR